MNKMEYNKIICKTCKYWGLRYDNDYHCSLTCKITDENDSCGDWISEVKMIPFPNKKYNIIYADPPWSYRVWSAKGGHKSASAHYNVMDINDICSMPVSKITDKDCVLFLWATYPNLQEAFKVVEDWGFTYKTVAFTWIKTYSSGNPVCGLGYWTRSNAEICLLATKGNPKRVDKGVYQVILSKLEKHSKKPSEARNRIVQLMGDLPRIELFARPPKDRLFEDESFKGWDVWGNEV